MMISGRLKNRIYSKKIKKALLTNAISIDENSGNIGLIVDNKTFNSLSELAELYKLIGIKKECFKIVVCGSPKKISDKSEVSFLTPKDISVSGDFKSESIINFAEEGFDFLICHFSETNTAGSLLAAETKARIKIGNSPDTYSIYDVEIQAEEIEVFQQEVLKYLKILKKE